MFRDSLLEQLAQSVPDEKRLDMVDRLVILRMDWRTAAFTEGVHLGMGLLAPRGRREGQSAPLWEGHRSK